MLNRLHSMSPLLSRTFISACFFVTVQACSQAQPATTEKGDKSAAQIKHAEAQTSLANVIDASSMDKRILHAFQAKDDAFWFGSDGNGVYCFRDKVMLHFTSAQGLAGSRVRSIQQDRAGAILVSTEEGVSRFDGRKFHKLTPINADPADGQWRLDPQDLWFPGWQDEGVVYRYDGTNLHRLAFPKTKPAEDHIANFPRAQFPTMTFSPYDIYTIFKDSNGHLWFGSCCLGACRYDGSTFTWMAKTELGFPADDSFGVRSITQDKSGKLWFSTTINRFDLPPAPSTLSQPTDKSQPTDLKLRKEPGINVKNNRPVYFLSSVMDKDDNLWLATYNDGIWMYDGTTMKHYPVMNGDAVVTVFSIYKDKQDQLWLGTHENGVYKFNGKSFEKVTF